MATSTWRWCRTPACRWGAGLYVTVWRYGAHVRVSSVCTCTIVLHTRCAVKNTFGSWHVGLLPPAVLFVASCNCASTAFFLFVALAGGRPLRKAGLHDWHELLNIARTPARGLCCHVAINDRKASTREQRQQQRQQQKCTFHRQPALQEKRLHRALLACGRCSGRWQRAGGASASFRVT